MRAPIRRHEVHRSLMQAKCRRQQTVDAAPSSMEVRAVQVAPVHTVKALNLMSIPYSTDRVWADAGT
jgi:hypothetical protein